MERGDKLFDSGLLSEQSFETGLTFHEQALEFYSKAKDTLGLGLAHYSIGRTNFMLYRDSAALSNYHRSFRYYAMERDSSEMRDAIFAIINFYGTLENQDSVNYYQEKLKSVPSGVEDIRGEAYNELEKAGIYLNFKDTINALVHFERADSLTYLLGDLNLRLKTLGKLSEINEAAGKHEQSLTYQKEMNRLQSKIVTRGAITQTEVVRAKLETEQERNKVISQKVRMNRMLYLVFGIPIFLLVLFAWFYQVNQKNKKLKDQQNQQKLKNLEVQSMENLLEVRDTERKRIAEDLHDRLGSTLTATRMLFESSANGEVSVAPQTQKAYQLLDKAIAETRHIAYNMLSGVLTKFGLEAALEDLKATVEEVSDLQFSLSYENLDERLNAELELNIYRIIQELVSNSLKYAQASQLNISLKRVDEDVEILIEDDGDGFDINAVKHGMGLKNIETRVKKFKGNWCCNSIKGKGTRTTINFTLYETTDQNFNSG